MPCCRRVFFYQYFIKQSTLSVCDKLKLEFRESDVSPGKTEVKQGEICRIYITREKGYFRERYKSKP